MLYGTDLRSWRITIQNWKNQNFKKMMAKCVGQIRVKQKDGSFSDVPCGRCGYCLSNRRKAWSFRLQKELREHNSASFITLTYSDENLVLATDDRGITYPVLHKPDWQNFMKRLRKAQSRITDTKIKYYAVGEYGSQTKRPHYHGIMFSLDPRLREHIDEIWGQGHSHVGNVTNDSIDYVTKYVVDKYESKHYLVPPFASISNGIGLKHLERNYDRYKGQSVVVNGRGYKQVVPRYYRDKMSQNRWTKKIAATKTKKLVEQKEADEIYRLEKLGHEEPMLYMDERALANSNKVLRNTSKNQTF
jgi:hypothetical protein